MNEEPVWRRRQAGEKEEKRTEKTDRTAQNDQRARKAYGDRGNAQPRPRRHRSLKRSSLYPFGENTPAWVGSLTAAQEIREYFDSQLCAAGTGRPAAGPGRGVILRLITVATVLTLVHLFPQATRREEVRRGERV